MNDLVSTRANPMVDPGLHVWGWEIPVYLFLGGFVAGLMVLTGHALYRGRHMRSHSVSSVFPLLGLGLLSLGMLALFLDLEHKLHVWRLYVTFELRSPMSWGSWILILVYPVLAASALVRLPEPLFDLLPGLRRLSGRLVPRPERVRAIGLLSMGLGAALGVYTGILLSSLGARPLWSSGLLPPLFLVSGLSTGAAFGHLVARDPGESVQLARADNAFLATELVLLGLFLIGLRSASEAHSRAAELLLGGPFTAVFWVGVVALGIVVPLLIQSLAVRHRVAHSPLAPVLVMLGGLLLRIVIVYAGQASRWPQT